MAIGSASKARLGWWLFVLSLGAAFLYVLYSFVGTFVLGIFFYYASRPVYRRVHGHVGSDGIAAAVTGIGLLLPLFALLAYTAVAVAGDLLAASGAGGGPVGTLATQVLELAGLSGAQGGPLTALATDPVETLTEQPEMVRQLLENGARVFSIIGVGMLHLGLSLTLAFYLLRDDDSIADIYRQSVGGTDTAAWAYASAVDRDLAVIFFGNVLFVVIVGVLAAAVYLVADVLSPPGLGIPFPFLLAALTGISSLIPIVVSKVVYVPLAGLLASQASRTDATMAFPLAFLVASFVLLDIFPQMVIQPYVTGRKITMALILFAYLLGPLLFGWYGVFLLPLLLVLGIHALRIVVEDLLHGDPITPDVEIEEGLGSDPQDGAGASSGPAPERGGRESPGGRLSGDGNERVE
jgi:predicted PurR-regulated permease PerM